MFLRVVGPSPPPERPTRGLGRSERSPPELVGTRTRNLETLNKLVGGSPQSSHLATRHPAADDRTNEPRARLGEWAVWVLGACDLIRLRFSVGSANPDRADSHYNNQMDSPPSPSSAKRPKLESTNNHFNPTNPSRSPQPQLAPIRLPPIGQIGSYQRNNLTPSHHQLPSLISNSQSAYSTSAPSLYQLAPMNRPGGSMRGCDTSSLDALASVASSVNFEFTHSQPTTQPTPHQASRSPSNHGPRFWEATRPTSQATPTLARRTFDFVSLGLLLLFDGSERLGREEQSKTNRV